MPLDHPFTGRPSLEVYFRLTAKFSFNHLASLHWRGFNALMSSEKIMVENPLFYQKIVPLNKELHKNLKLDTGEARFGFARQAHMIPLVAEEFVVGGRALPIVFVPGAERASPVFLLGLRPGENHFVSNDGRWTAPYVPAFLRRYPFIIGEVNRADSLICIDERAPALSENGGEPLFLENGDHAPALDGTIKFVNDYLVAAKRTEAFVDELQRMNLFRTITIDIKAANGEARTLHGVMSIDPDKLQALPDADFLKLRSTGALPVIYAHLASLAALETLVTSAPASKNGAAPEAERAVTASAADDRSLPN